MLGPDAVALNDLLGRVARGVGDAAARRQHTDLVGDQLERVAVAGQDRDPLPRLLGPARQRADQVVGLEPGQFGVDEPERLHQRPEVRPTARETDPASRHGRPCTPGTASCRNVLPGASQQTTTRLGRSSVDDLHHHRRQTVERVGRKAVGGRDSVRQRKERPVRQAVAVDQHQLARGRRRGRLGGRLERGHQTRAENTRRGRAADMLVVPPILQQGAILSTRTTPSAQYSVTIRVEHAAGQPGLFGALGTAINAVGGDVGAVDIVSSDARTVVRDIVVNASDPEHADEIVAAAGRVDGRDRGLVIRPDVQTAPRRQDRDGEPPAAQDPRGPGGRRRAGHRDRVSRHRRRSRQGVRPDAQAQHGRRHHQRHRRAGPRRHRRRRRHAGHGGQGDAVQGVRRRRRLRAVRRLQGPAGADRHLHRGRARVRRDQPRGHLRAGVLRGRGPPQGDARHPGVPRRPARHRDRRARGLHQRPQADGRHDGRAEGRRSAASARPASRAPRS